MTELDTKFKSEANLSLLCNILFFTRNQNIKRNTLVLKKDLRVLEKIQCLCLFSIIKWQMSFWFKTFVSKQQEGKDLDPAWNGIRVARGKIKPGLNWRNKFNANSFTYIDRDNGLIANFFSEINVIGEWDKNFNWEHLMREF